MRHEADDAKTQIQLQNITDAEAEALIVRSVELFNEVRENWWQSEGREQGRVYPLCLAGIGPYGAYLANDRASAIELDTSGIPGPLRRV